MILSKELYCFFFSSFLRVVLSGRESEKEGKMDVTEAGSSLDSLVSSFNARIAEIQQLVVARNSKLSAPLFAPKLVEVTYYS